MAILSPNKASLFVSSASLSANSAFFASTANVFAPETPPRSLSIVSRAVSAALSLNLSSSLSLSIFDFSSANWRFNNSNSIRIRSKAAVSFRSFKLSPSSFFSFSSFFLSLSSCSSSAALIERPCWAFNSSKDLRAEAVLILLSFCCEASILSVKPSICFSWLSLAIPTLKPSSSVAAIFCSITSNSAAAFFTDCAFLSSPAFANFIANADSKRFFSLSKALKEASSSACFNAALFFDTFPNSEAKARCVLVIAGCSAKTSKCSSYNLLVSTAFSFKLPEKSSAIPKAFPMLSRAFTSASFTGIFLSPAPNSPSLSVPLIIASRASISSLPSARALAAFFLLSRPSSS